MYRLGIKIANCTVDVPWEMHALIGVYNDANNFSFLLSDYVNSIAGLPQQYLAEAKALIAQGNRDKATVLMTKKKYVEKEVSTGCYDSCF